MTFATSLNDKPTAVLLMHCRDQKGIVAKITEFLQENNGNIIYLDQYVDTGDERFFMRVEWELTDFSIPAEKIADYFETLIAIKFNMTWNIYFSGKKPKMGIFVSKMSHCLYDLLARYESGEWHVEVPVIISNHESLQPIAEKFGVEFHYIPINKNNKKEQEAKELEILKNHQVNFIVLARYMQIISPEFIKSYPNKIINIHHSFLPAFMGAKPYHAAYERGVKIIGATSHYATGELDAGPIIEQDIVRISHHDTVNKLIYKGRDLEKIVLARAVHAHLQRKTLVYKNRTIIFS